MARDHDPLRELEHTLAPLIERARSAAKTDFACAREGRRWRLELWGSLPPSWAGNLSLHCPGVGIDIVEGVAWRFAASRWVASFVLAPVRKRSELRGFDFVRMARRRPRGATRAGLPRLDEFALEGRLGALAALVRGKDEPGFLAAVLARFASCQLHPVRLAIGSEDGLAIDWFLLESAIGREPSPPSVDALRRALLDCVVPIVMR